MPYGRRAYSKRRTPYKRFRRKYKKRLYRRKKAVKPYAKNIQSGTRIPRSRLVQTVDTRSFIVQDDNNLGKPIYKSFNLNDPEYMWDGQEFGTWAKSDFGNKDNKLPNLDHWVTDTSQTGTALYRHGQVVKTTLQASVRPVPTDTQSETMDYDTMQDVSHVIIGKCTAAADLQGGTQMSATHNCDTEKAKAFVRSGTTYLNQSGTPRGTTVKMGTYKFDNMNRSKGRSYANGFQLGQRPGEKDHAYLTILPSDNRYANKYIDPTSKIKLHRCGAFRVTIQIVCTVLYTEPNTTHSITEGAGNILQQTASGIRQGFTGLFSGSESMAIE